MRHTEYFILLGLFVGLLVVYNLLQADFIGLISKMKFSENVTSIKESEPKLTFDKFKGVPQDDPSLIEFIRSEILHPPSKAAYNLQLPKNKHFSEHGQSQLAEQMFFKGVRNGFFIEVGAINGEFLSTTLFFEREYGWTGLLIEPNHDTFEQLLKKGRKAYSVNAGLSPVKSPSVILLNHKGLAGKESIVSQNEEGQSINAYPLYSLLLALKVDTIDFFSLDIEGQEMKILPTLPWDKLKFKVLCIESFQTPGGEQNLVKFVEEKGYKCIGKRHLDHWFVHPEFWNETIKL